MRLYLAKTLEGLSMYGSIYNLGSGVPDKVEDYAMEYQEYKWMLDNLIDRINASCDTLLDDGDVDYIGAEKCKDLVTLLENLPDGFVPEDYKVVTVLKNFATRAIEYNTGIAIEM
ncbi:hypothetical protein [Butyrivibrio fibrisolvens]|uniref:hypothetical protein n=1 Tax=Butyrivibrio fibrisolvens TaxID=831 RepID=UPI000489E5EA|nr:hypothetical protein [Butyrivibrio fibrisolvens]